MRYVLRSRYLENTHEHPISLERFLLLKRCRRVLTAALEIEDVFDQLMSNYITAETRCLELTSKRLVRQHVGYREANETMSTIALVFANYLSTSRAYVDKLGSAASRCFDGSASEVARNSVKALLAEQYDSAFDYRFIEALRNHVQHSGTALHILSQGSRRISAGASRADPVFETFLLPQCSKARLVELGGFKASVLAECPDQINLLDCMRGHVGGLSRVHRRVRDLTATEVSTAAGHIQQGQTELAGKVAGDLDATEAVAIDGEEEQDSVPLLLHWEEVRRWLIERNTGVPDGLRTFPSGRCEPR